MRRGRCQTIWTTFGIKMTRLSPMSQWISTCRDIRTSARFLRAVGPFLRTRLSPDECRQRIVDHLRDRDASFLRIVRSAMYGDRTSPYGALARHAGIEFGDVEGLVRTEGVEGTVGRLHDAGVRLTLDEFKGRRAIRRGSVEIAAGASSFDNHLPSQQFVAQTGGSRSRGRRMLVDLDLLAHEACYEFHSATQLGYLRRPKAMWRPVPPGAAGLNGVLRFSKIDAPVDRWFSQSPVRSAADWRHTLFTAGLVTASRLAGEPLASPEHVPVDRADVVAQWLARCRTSGAPGLVDTNTTAAVRVCRAAEARGLAIDGSIFRLGGEPYSPGKAAVLARTGCRGYSNYSMTEIGRIGIACADQDELDDVHVLSDKVALLQRDVRLPGGHTVQAFVATALARSTPKVMINVELGDYGTLTKRPCGCVWSRLGFAWHLHGIRSYEKLTAEGMHFLGADLETILDHVLPARFGGGPTDYQVIEEEHDGATMITLLIDPRVGAVDEATAVAMLLDGLASSGPAQRMMANRWREAGVVRVKRGEAQVTRAGKILSLHLQSPGA